MIRNIFQKKKIQQFINHNKKNFRPIKLSNNNSKILVEFNGWPTFHLSNSYLINALKTKYKCEVIAYENYNLLLPNKNKIIDNFKWLVGSNLKIKNFALYHSLGVDKFMKIKIDKSISSHAKIIFEKKYKLIKSLKDLENLKIYNILIGDLLYDSYLKKFNESSIDINSQKFKFFFKSFLENFVFWRNYFTKHKIVAVSASHGVYSFAIPLRIGLSKNIDCFNPSESKLYNFKYLKKDKFISNTSAYQEDGLYFKKIFSKFSKKKKIECLDLGKKIFKKKIKHNFQLHYVKKKEITKSIKKNSNKTGILIMAHSFFDSPHAFGKNLFTDFKQWLIYLEKLSSKNKDKYDWYIKPHPNVFDLTKKEILQYAKKNDHIRVLDKNSSYSEFKKLNIKVILTIYGTVSSESFAHNIISINASRANRYRDFAFSLSPKNLKDYEENILNFQKYKKRIFSKKSTHEIYLLNYFQEYYFNKNYLFTNFEKYINNKKKQKQHIYTDDFYIDWLKEFDQNLDKKIKIRINKFLKSKSYTLINSNY